MSESMRNLLRNLLILIVFIFAVVLVFIGQKNIGASGLGTMLLGLALLIGLLWFYNRKYK
ncbi:DUF6903 family protein [Paenibacillus macquariensis]|uniref:LPXTG-motif cell wall anchor domain-containing protein n=1 Tax=Paenibacillus macquariensis TaxID=948756 RepID=A0ABY1JZC5_9BACL|nr:hypothetical protein [Paenibacillus macquariensis]MEC0091293.1 hypothetical protein [Paenibacillus macquariensis]OAB37985.1 hypothetical protein PMSM_02260 [Paenibacillus macquariensis subsp. macquariensis]SIR03728.1 hypothetical protein SAMN05421578_106101 [Paenibacillus macquariensis]